ncbi:hypothetical protein KIM67_14180 [Flagellimonas sp. 389]|uniref:hypothetical protein n=1 Tax=Flagellimonas sp. 389 TaxID=2835862 RepID=UPI001BD47664|nr:hypothetical protein [Flagellimonas sp. 389]MBS9463562.1 hypothetical protein [Flagellimonas sp. 389]
MKIKALLLIFIVTKFPYDTVYGQGNENKISVQKTSKINARLIVSSGVSEKNIPLNNLKEINVKEGEKVFFYINWFNLTKNSYTTSMDFLDVNNNFLAQSSAYKFRPKKKTHNTWNSRKFREIIIPEGVLKIRINLDQEIILEREIKVKYKTE